MTTSPLDPNALDHIADVIADRVAAQLANQLELRPELVDANAAGQLLSVPSTWLLAEARANRVPHVRLGKYVRFRPADLAAWLDDRSNR